MLRIGILSFLRARLARNQQRTPGRVAKLLEFFRPARKPLMDRMGHWEQSLTRLVTKNAASSQETAILTTSDGNFRDLLRPRHPPRSGAFSRKVPSRRAHMSHKKSKAPGKASQSSPWLQPPAGGTLQLPTNLTAQSGSSERVARKEPEVKDPEPLAENVLPRGSNLRLANAHHASLLN